MSGLASISFGPMGVSETRVPCHRLHGGPQKDLKWMQAENDAELALQSAHASDRILNNFDRALWYSTCDYISGLLLSIRVLLFTYAGRHASAHL